MRRAKIIATIGPATQSQESLRQLMEAGLDVVRFNFSHGDHAFYAEAMVKIRQLSEELSRPIAIMQDLQGVKIRTGCLENSQPVELTTGQRLIITTKRLVGGRDRISTSYKALPQDVQPGDRILLSDGLIELLVSKTSKFEVDCEIVSGGILAENQGINLPGVSISAPPLTEKDIQDLNFGIQQGVDYIALSFVRRAEDLVKLKKKIAESKHDMPVIAKLETPMAIENLEAILEECDGVMVARGDLGVEVNPEKVPVIQKQAVKQANHKGKLVIIATQMLDSMIHNPRPTRAEASDVANAVFDGADALMLSGETAIGHFPVESVVMMSRIISQAESLGTDFQTTLPHEETGLSFPEAVCDAAYHASNSIQARAIAAFTQTGSTARLISKFRPSAEILGVTPHPHIVTRLPLLWGVRPLLMPEIRLIDELIGELEQLLLQQDLVKKGDHLIILTGAPILEQGHINLMKLHRLGGEP